jgi:two-component system, NarL family, sensor histidine kinase DegS
MHAIAPAEQLPGSEDHLSRRELTRLKWLATIVPGAAVLLYEGIRYETLEHVLPGVPPQVGNVIVAVLVLLLTYAFASFVFRVVERVQSQAVRRGREVAALNAVVEERARLSRELHDGLAQLITLLMVRLDTVAGLVQADRGSEALAELERLRGLADDLYLDVREAIAGLRSRVSERGLVPALRDYLDEFEERHGIRVSLEADDPTTPVPDVVGSQLFRIAQEALANVRKHARAERAWASIRHPQPAVLVLEIGDDGVGFDPERAPRATASAFGLASMRERAEVLGGTFRVDSAPGAGTRISVRVPLDSRAIKREEARGDALASAAG